MEKEQQIICSHKCSNDNCKYHPAAARPDGSEAVLKDMLMKPGCPGRSKE